MRQYSIDPKSGLALPSRRFGMKKFQRGILHPVGFWQEPGSAAVVTLSGESIFHDVNNGNTATAAVSVNTDGTVDKLNPNATQIDAATDWIIPRSAGVGTGYYWKYTMLGVASYNPNGLTANTWYEITANRIIGAQESSNDTQEFHNITIHISDDGGTTTLDTAVYTCTATVGLPL